MSLLEYQIEVDATDSGAWASMLDLFQDANIYQTFSYGAVRWGEENLSHIVLKNDLEVLAIAQLRIFRPTSLKCGMAYLRWGPLWSHARGRDTQEIATLMARALEQEYVIKRGLLLRVLPNAFIGSERAALFKLAFERFTSTPTPYGQYRTSLVDLSPSLEELRRMLGKKWRNALSRAEKNGLEVVVGDSAKEFQVFTQMYKEMLNRKNFETTVSIEEFGRVQEDLPKSHRMQTLICRQSGVPVASIVCSAMGNSAIYLLGATSDRGLNANGAYLLQWKWIQILKGRGLRWYDLGGIDPERNPGVYHFKVGLSGVDAMHLDPLTASNGRLSSSIVATCETGYRLLVDRVRTFRARSVTK